MPPPQSCFLCPKFIVGTFASAFLILAVCEVNAGTWTLKPWKDDADLPKPAADTVTHAVAFGIDMAPPAPKPFQITSKGAGENWEVLRLPERTASVVVGRRSERAQAVSEEKGVGGALMRGRILSKGKGGGGLELDLNGLEAGKKYHLVFFGLGFGSRSKDDGDDKDYLLKAEASDVSGHVETLKLGWRGGRYMIYEYTAPSDGQLVLSIVSGNPNEENRKVGIGAFLNYRAE